MTAEGSVSVCVATYNGAAYVEEQIVSILDQIGPDDEVIVVDDCSRDDTVARVRALGDGRVRVIENRINAGYARRFEDALRAASGQHIFLADQDDVWAVGRVAAMQRALADHLVVAGNLDRLGDGASVRPRGAFGGWALQEGQERQRIRMILRLAASQAPYYGSAMALHRSLLAVALPFPASARELHDGWLALLGLLSGSMGHVEKVVVHRRVHESNATGSPRGLRAIVAGRILFSRMLVAAWRRTRRTHR